jgi:hypothetical protein
VPYTGILKPGIDKESYYYLFLRLIDVNVGPLILKICDGRETT